MNQKGSFIVIHGIDGTGKTTTVRMLVKFLAERGISVINYDNYETANPFSLAKEAVIAGTAPEAQFAFYIGSTLYHSQMISEILAQGVCVVKARYLEDVLAHHAHLGVANAREIATLFSIRAPDLTVILTLPEPVRRARILVRGEVDLKDKEIRRVGSRLDFFEHFLLESARLSSSPRRSLVVDTSTFPPEEVAQMIIERMQEIDVIPKASK